MWSAKVLWNIYQFLGVITAWNPSYHCGCLHNTAINGLVISTTSFSHPEKELEQLKSTCQVSTPNNYHQDVSHLVVKMVGYEKYIAPTKQNFPFFHEKYKVEWSNRFLSWQGWVMGVWEAVNPVSATYKCFLPYKCKMLHRLVVCLSQVDQHTRTDVRRVIKENGTTYIATLGKGSTSVVIVSSPMGTKYNFGIKWGIHCEYRLAVLQSSGGPCTCGGGVWSASIQNLSPTSSWIMSCF